MESLKEFARKNLGPVCGPKKKDKCSAADKKLIEKFEAMTDEKLGEYVGEKSQEVKKIEQDAAQKVRHLQAEITRVNEKKGKDIEAINAAGLTMAKAVVEAGTGGIPPETDEL